MSSYKHSVNDDEDALFERIKEESLRHYNEVELPRINKESDKNDDNVPRTDLSVCEESQPISKKIWYEGSEAQGFYLLAGSSYIYPTNYPVREYQENIVKTALFKNTLVSLPTGLGKTFIAAVVMYNYYRWYPKGKIVFMAPTRPLVAQQIKACYNIMGLPVEDTTEMTGNLNVQDRVKLWMDKRVFFLTPQVMVNDIRSKSCPAKSVKCLVVDEAHRAVKDYAYCHVVSLLDEEHAVYRLLALSATPGNDVKGVQQIIQNLKISSLEFRGEDALDVMKYTHQKNVQSIVVNLSINIQRVKSDFLHIYDKYAKRLRECKAMNCNISTVTKFQVLKASEKFRAHPPRGLPPATVGSIICDFSVCMSLAHALELLQIYGLRAFHSYLSEGGEKNKAATTRLRKDEDLGKILARLKQILFKKPGEENYIWGHPKLYKLTSVLTDHFNAAKEMGEKTKAIIFCQYRVVVTEVFEVLETLNTDIKPIMFIGQSSSNSKDRGMTQAKQLEIMKDFRMGVYNCMIATCVAEEGLDIGEVDLIVLMEAHKSPIRLVQRIGRTGRKRSGKCIVLVTEGREEYKFQEAMAARKSYVSNVLNAKSVRDTLYPNCPSMLPQGVKPVRQLLHIEVVEQVSPEKPATSKQVDIRSCLVPEESPFLTTEEFKKVTNEVGKKSLNFSQIPESSFLFHRFNNERMPIDELLKKDFTTFSDWNDWNMQLHEVHELSHSSESEMMCGLLNRFYTFDVKFFNVSTLEENKKRKREDEKMDVDTDEELITSKKGKKTKKEVDKVKFGMDIRHCMAAAKDKVRTQQPFDPNEIIDLDDSHNLKNNQAGSNDKLVDEVIQSLEKEMNITKNLSEVKNINLSFLDNSVKLLDSFSIQTKKRESSMFSIFRNLSLKKDSLVSSLLADLESLKLESEIKKPEEVVEEILHPDIFWDNESIKSVKESQKSPDSLVGLDDLFDDGKETITPNSVTEHDEPSKGHKLDHENTVSMPINKHLNLQLCADRPNTPSPQGSNQFWESLPEELLDLKEITTPNRNKYLAASTPINNKLINSLKKNRDKCFPVNTESPISKTKNSDVWNFDDLFEDDDIDKHGKPNTSQNSNDSTMLGITQMISLIEREKLADKQKDKNDISEDVRQDKSRVNKTTECKKEDKSEEEIDKLLDEDDDFFTSMPNIDITPIKNTIPTVNNISHNIKNLSSDMFASTAFQSRILENDCTFENVGFNKVKKIISPKKSEENIQKNVDKSEENIVTDVNEIFEDSDDSIIVSDEETQSKIVPNYVTSQYFDNATGNKDELSTIHNSVNLVDKINNPGENTEANFVTDINDLLNNSEESDECIIVSEEEENECVASQRTLSAAGLSKIDIPAHNNSSRSNSSVSITLRNTKNVMDDEPQYLDNAPVNKDQLSTVHNSVNLVDKINNSGRKIEANFVTDINDLLNNSQESDECIVLSEEEENECIASQRALSAADSSKIDIPAHNNSSRSNSSVSITVRNTTNFMDDEHLEEQAYAEVKIDVPNFKRFNKRRPALTELPSNLTMESFKPSSTQTKVPVVTKTASKVIAEEKKGISDESWWFEFDFPSNYPQKDIFKSEKPLAVNQNIQKKHVSNETPDYKTHSQSSNLRKITDFVKPINKILLENNSSCKNTSEKKNESLNVRRDETLLLEQKKSIQTGESFKHELLLNNAHHIKNNNDIIDEPWTISDVLSLGKSNSEKNIFCINKKNNAMNNRSNRNKSLDESSTSKEDSIKSISTNLVNNRNKSSLLEFSDDEEVFKDFKNASKSSKENSRDEKRRVEKVRSSSDHKKKRRRKRAGNEFIDKEAEVSEDENTSSGNDEMSDLDGLEESFIDDEHQNSVNMHAKYLQSVKSPVRGKFKIPQNFQTNNINVYSQYEANDSEYVNDSFCVDSEESTDENALSAIEIAERKLEKKRKMKKQNDGQRKRRRIRIVSPDHTNNLDEDTSILSDKSKSAERSESLINLKKKKRFQILSDSEGTASDSSPFITNKQSAKLTQTTLKMNSKKSLNFNTGLSNKNKNNIIQDDDDEDFQRAIRESQQEFMYHEKKSRELEERELLEAIERSKAEIDLNLPSTSRSYL